MIDLTIGYSRRCKTSIGGFRYLWVTPFVKYPRSQIITDGLTLISYPATVVYKFDVSNGQFEQSQISEDGGKFYEQSLSAEFIKIEAVQQFQKFLKKDYLIIVQDYKGKFRMMGTYNGVFTETLNENTGGSRDAFNGYKLNFTAREETQALFFDSLSDVGFIDPSVSNNYVFDKGLILELQNGNLFELVNGDNLLINEGDNYEFEDNNNYIFN